MPLHRVHHVFLADTARVTGHVTLGQDVSVWFGAAIRGDVASITIGQGTNIQDNAVVHVDTGAPNHIGSGVTVGHGAIVHGRSVGDGSLIGMAATVLGGTVIGRGCLIAAGALVTPGTIVPDGMLLMGVPGRVVRAVNEEEREYLRWLAPHYVELAGSYVANPDHHERRPWSGNPITAGGSA